MFCSRIPRTTCRLIGLIAALIFTVGQAHAVDLGLDLVASGFSRPILATHAPDGSDRLFVVEQAGRIRIIGPDGTVGSQDFLDLGTTGLDLVSPFGGEQGLLGLAFHPGHACNGRFFVHYTRRSDGDSIISEFSVSENPNVANTDEQIILGPVFQPEGNHNGGMIEFGPDGMLYIALGDGGGGGDPHGEIGNGQNTTNLLGKILRIDVDNPQAPNNYGIPPDNPFVGMEGFREEIWAYGLRNPWRFSFDRADGRLFCADVGQNAIEEVDIIEKGGNYGWRRMEGSECFNPPTDCQTGSLILPIDEYPHSLGCSVTGGYVYRGVAYPDLEGLYFFGDYCSGRIWSLEETAPDVWTRTDQTNSSFRIPSFGEDESGEVYVCDLNGGAVYQLVDNDPAPAMPVVAVAPPLLAFPDQDLREDACGRRIITIANVGEVDLNFTGNGIEIIGPDQGAYAIVNSPETSSPLGRGERVVVAIAFDPGALGGKFATLRVSTDDPVNPTVNVAMTGEGVPVTLSRFAVD